MEPLEYQETLALNPLDTFKCGTCQLEVSDLNLFLLHKRQGCFQQEQVLQLEEDEEVEEENEVLKVVATPITQKPYVIDHLTCSICLKRFKRRYDLKQHLQIHSNDKPNKCEICGKAFVQKSNLKQHLAVHQKKNDTKVNISQSISFDVLTKSGRKIAIEPKRTYNCKACNFETHSSALMKTHQEANHKFRCTLCEENEIFESEVELSAHLELKHNGQKVEKEFYACEECEQTFASKKLLQKHWKTCKNDEKAFQCSLCNKSFTTQGYLKKHFLTHGETAEFKCNTCDKTFKRADNLKRHEKQIHGTDVQIYKCPFESIDGCKREFKRYDKLKDHVKTHGNVKILNCDFCQDTFIEVMELRRHINEKHENIEVETLDDVQIEVIEDVDGNEEGDIFAVILDDE